MSSQDMGGRSGGMLGNWGLKRGWTVGGNIKYFIDSWNYKVMSFSISRYPAEYLQHWIQGSGISFMRWQNYNDTWLPPSSYTSYSLLQANTNKLWIQRIRSLKQSFLFTIHQLPQPWLEIQRNNQCSSKKVTGQTCHPTQFLCQQLKIILSFCLLPSTATC